MRVCVLAQAGFGTGDYDFAKLDIPQLKVEYADVEKRVVELKGKVNSKVWGAGALPAPRRSGVEVSCMDRTLPF